MTKKSKLKIILMLILFSIGSLFSRSTENIIKKYRFDFSPDFFYYDGGTANFKYKAYKADDVYGGWEVDPEEILLIYDSSDGKVKTGFFITEDAIYYRSTKSLFSKRAEGRISLENLETISFDCPDNGRGSCYSLYLNDIKIKMMTSHSKNDDKLLEELFTAIIANNQNRRWQRGDVKELYSECIDNRIGDKEVCTCIARKISKEFDSLEDVYNDPMDPVIIMEVLSLECENDKRRSEKRKSKRKKKKPATDPDKVYNVEDAGSIVIGNPNALVTIVQWMDYQCPYCAKFSDSLDVILEKYPNDVRVVIKNFPLSSHKQARQAAEYCLAAEEVSPGSYWDMYLNVFKDYRSLKSNPDMPLEVARNLGINVRKLIEVAKSESISEQIDKEIKQMRDAGFPRLAVPKFLINGKEPQGRRDIGAWSEIIDELISKKTSYIYTLKNNNSGIFTVNSNDLISIRLALKSGGSVAGLAIGYNEGSKVITIKKSNTGEIRQFSQNDIKFIYFNYKDGNRKAAKFVEVVEK